MLKIINLFYEKLDIITENVFEITQGHVGDMAFLPGQKTHITRSHG